MDIYHDVAGTLAAHVPATVLGQEESVLRCLRGSPGASSDDSIGASSRFFLGASPNKMNTLSFRHCCRNLSFCPPVFWLQEVDPHPLSSPPLMQHFVDGFRTITGFQPRWQRPSGPDANLTRVLVLSHSDPQTFVREQTQNPHKAQPSSHRRQNLLRRYKP